MKKKLAFIILLALICTAQAQTFETVTIEQSAQQIAVDPQGNIYAVNDATLYKYAPDGTLLYTYNDNLLGHIASIDVGNPLKIMLFYRDGGCILFLNDKLSLIGDRVDLFPKGLTTILLATYSTKNELIVYDESNTDLVILDFYFREKERIHYDFQEFFPTLLTDVNEKMLVMQDPQQGVFFFDNFGTFEKNIAIKSEWPVQIINDQIIYIKDNQLNSYNYKTLDARIVADIGDVAGTIRQVLISHNRMILLDEKNIKIIRVQ